MTEQQITTPELGEQETEAADGRTTDYVVLVVHDLMGAEAADGKARELWREVGVLSVPLATRRATVLQKAGELAAGFPAEEGQAARFRVWPLAEQQEGEAELEVPEPQLKVTAR